jgi:hypothetical protein
MSTKSDNEKERRVEGEDQAAVREMNRRLAKDEASREWRWWFLVMGGLIGIPVVVWFGLRMAQAFLMSGF